MKFDRLTPWLLALRPFSFSASGTTLFLVYGIINFTQKPFLPQLFWPLLLGSFALHAACNMINDYFDFLEGIDAKSKKGINRTLVDGHLEPKSYPPVIVGLILTALLCSIYLYLIRGNLIIIFTGLALFSAYAYTGKPFYLKYRALGELTVFLFMGILLPVAAFFVLSGALPQKELLLFVAPAFLLVAILLANNIRDLQTDRKAKIKTLPIIIGRTPAIALYIFLILSAYLFAFWSSSLLSGKLFNLAVLLILFSLPGALKNMFCFSKENTSAKIIALIDVKTAQLHASFTLLFAISLLIK